VYQKARGENYNANGDSSQKRKPPATAALRFASSYSLGPQAWERELTSRAILPPARILPAWSTNSAVFQAPVSTGPSSRSTRMDRKLASTTPRTRSN